MPRYDPALVSIRQASHLLGVSEATLRQWTDRGYIKAFVTPGGHRRYSLTELKSFVSTHRKIHRIRELVASLNATSSVHQEMARSFLDSGRLAGCVNKQARDTLSGLGRSLFNLVIQQVSGRSKPARIEDEVRDIGRKFGRTMAEMGISLVEAVESFIMHREPFIEAATEFLRRREAVEKRVVDAVTLTVHIMDTALISMIAAYQEHHLRGSPPNGGI